MSQFWHAHWAEDGFKPTRLQNWEVPRWHAEWPDRHCTTTKFEAHKNGRLFASAKKSNNSSPWGNFKGTWELPLKIDRRTAEELSRSTEYKKKFWTAHKAKHQRICKGICTDFVLTGEKNKDNENQNENEEKKEAQVEGTIGKIKNEDDNQTNLDESNLPKNKCKIEKKCKF
ncbi:hypothetical protein TSAR_001086 [Trichomalopsis sarcophagae]|uniref:Cilia- and flagella-associated protein 126 n=1 Tax=Trichomalopsis sarcophagae TaxID=543379 RepID=A0A232FCS7_9HYME|nr:hypothetical protein TSAR_001086 [Trichomalopsis sarcophagae]